MTRTYTRTTEINTYTTENLQRALQAIRDEGRKIREVGRCFSIPESTLRKKLLETRPIPTRLGRKAVFSKELETELKEYILILAKLFYGVTPTELRRLVFRYAEEKKIRHNFNKQKGLAGKDWLYGFLKRNPEVALRQPEGTSLNRIVSFNAEETSLFYANLTGVMDKYKFKENRIFNVDETGLSTVQKKCPKVYAPKGAKKVGAAISAERGRTITAVFAVSAAGNYIPPMLIYPRKRMTPTLQKNGPIGATYKCSKNGWINGDLFLEWLNHFAKHAKPTESDPILLILDNHSSHISVEIYDFCKTNFIHMVSLPPHTSHHLQPLDLTFFGPLKGALYREYDLQLSSTGHEKITEYDVAELLNRAFMKVATMEKAVAGFRSAGIFPLNPDRFDEDDFAPANQVRAVRIEGSPEPETTTVSSTPPLEDEHHSGNEAGPSTIVPDKQPDKQPVQESLSSSYATNTFVTHTSPLSKKTDARPTSTKPSRKTSRKKQHSEILTSTPVKLKLDEAKEKKVLKEEKTRKKKIPTMSAKKGKGRKKQKMQITPVTSDSSEEDVPNLCDDSDDEMDEVDCSVLPMPREKPNTNCCICGEIGRDKELWYRCVLCSSWNHAECSGADSPKGYVCDYCASAK